MSHDDDTCPHLVVLGRLEAENAHLKAEVERLTAFTTRTIIPNEELQAEVERLYRHGDLMLKFAAANMTFPAYATMAKDWNAAKEGKQS